MDNNITELEAELKRTQEELDKLEAQEKEEIEKISADEPEETPEAPEEEAQEETPEEVAEVVEPEVTPEAEDSPEEDLDLKKRLTDSEREALILNLRQKKFNEAITEADSMPEPTAEELEAEAARKGFLFDEMSDVEKALFKDSLMNQRKINKISEVAKEGKDLEEWNGRVDTYIEDPQTLIAHPQLEGKSEEFKRFANKPTRRGINFDELVAAFLWNSEQTKVKHKGKMFETGSGGANEKVNPKGDKLTAEEGAKLMRTNYNLYKEKLLAGKIANE